MHLIDVKYLQQAAVNDLTNFTDEIPPDPAWEFSASAALRELRKLG